jgi:hypothetical protein
MAVARAALCVNIGLSTHDWRYISMEARDGRREEDTLQFELLDSDLKPGTAGGVDGFYALFSPQSIAVKGLTFFLL